MDKGCRGETEGQRIQVPTNPLHGYCADPDLKMVDGRWYMYCTQDGLPGWSSTVMSVYESTDLCTWQEHRILDLHDVPWWEGKQGAWAPCMLETAHGFVLYFVADGQIGLATSSTPTGPFTPAATPLIRADAYDCQTIDPSIFVDEDGTTYLLWGNGRVYMAALSDDGTAIVDATLKTWVPDNFREAITISRHGGRYYASWSENDTRDPEYRVRYAVSDSLDGPWGQPQVLVEKDEGKGILGTGHHCILQVPGTDQWIIAYHRFAMDGHGDGCHREIVCAPLAFDDEGGMKQVHPQVGSYWCPAPSTQR